MDLSSLVCSFSVASGHHPKLCLVYGTTVISEYLAVDVRLFLKFTNNLSLRLPAGVLQLEL